MNTEPTHLDITEKLSGIVTGKQSRAAVAEWAFTLMDDDSLRIRDALILHYLTLAGAVDLPSTDRPYLYTDEDIADWISELTKG